MKSLSHEVSYKCGNGEKTLEKREIETAQRRSCKKKRTVGISNPRLSFEQNGQRQ